MKTPIYGCRPPSSQASLPVDEWHEVIDTPIYANAVLDSVSSKAPRIELTCDVHPNA
ncbi:hypothetical protein IVB33_39265 [Bradyrhizobium sp. 24]|nr:hypothetical protein [Bradyrhizobium sp. 24]